MSLIVQNLLSNSSTRFSLYFANNSYSNPLKTNDYFMSSFRRDFADLPQFLALRRNHQSFQIHHRPARAFEGVGTSQPEEAVDKINLDAILSVLEFLCLASSAMVSIGLIWSKSTLAWLGNRVFVWQSMLLIGAMAIGTAIRSRQWRRVSNFSRRGGEKVNLVERIEKLEEELRSSATIIRVLSRQLEKLGIRFRVTRKTLKDPIAEAVSLAQKNSEATRALAAQEDILEKELSEIQKVLLAMQDQQQKQLELILALGKTGKLWDMKQGPPTQEEEAIERHNKPTGEGPNPIIAPRI